MGFCRKAVRATLVLLPLFGTHFVVTIYRPPSIPGSCKWIELYYYVDYILDGLQGFLVALIFCYVNGEVGYRRKFFLLFLHFYCILLLLAIEAYRYIQTVK